MGIGDMAKVILSFVIFYCFEFSACSHFVILNSFGPFFLEYHHVVVSESLQGSSHICISVKLDLFRQRSPQRRNVAKYL